MPKLAAVWIVFTTACAAAPPVPDVGPPELVMEAVVALGSTPVYGGHVVEHCAGFMYKGRVITAQHCLANINRFYSVKYLGDVLWTPAHVDFLSKKYDVAFLTPSHTVPKQSVVFTGEWVTGERVYAIGHPGGKEYTVTFGEVKYKDHRDGREFLVTSAKVRPGNSGGPMVTARGQVLGMAIAYRGTLESLHLPSWVILSEFAKYKGGK